MGLRMRGSALLLLLVLFLPLLAACGASNSTGEAAPTAAPAPGEIGGPTIGPAAGGEVGAAATSAPAGEAASDGPRLQVEEGAVLRFGAGGNPSEQQLYQQGLERFKQAYPNVQISFEPINDYQTSIKAAFSANSAPDVFLLDGELMGAFAPNELLLPLDGYIQEAGINLSDYFEPTLELFQSEGSTLGLPKDFNPLVLFINNELAQQAGVDPQSIKTWDDMKAAAQKMTQGEGPGKTFGLCLNPDILRAGAFVFQNGNNFIADNKAVFNQPNGVAAIEFWKSFKDDGTGELYGELGKGWCGEAFAGRNTAMVVEGGWLVPFMADSANGAQDMAYSAIPLPTPADGEQATWLFTNGFAANANTQFPKAAAAAVLFLAGEANQRALIPSGLAQPTLKTLTSDPYYSENEVARVLIEQGQNGRLADTVLGGPVKKGDVLKPINEAMERIFLSAQSVPEALNQAAQEVDGVLQR